MKKILFLVTICLAGLTTVFAQNKKIILSGAILEKETSVPINQATIQLLSLPDSLFVSGTVSRQKGHFSLAAKPGKYLLRISFVGYTTLEKDIQLTPGKPALDLGNLYLASDGILLEEAIIVAEAPPVTIKADTTEYAASAYRTPEGAMLEELVKKLPGAQVDEDGKIIINGKEVKKIMVDGKEFFSDDPKVSMKNLPVNMVDKVKAYDKKSDAARITGIDDGEEETVLDLTVKKGMKKGWIGNLIAGYGTKDRYEAGVMLNRFKDDTSFSVIGSINNTNNAGFSEFGDAGQGLSSGGAGSGITSARSVGLNYAHDTQKLRVNGNIQYGYSDNDSRRKNSTESFIGKVAPFSDDENESLRSRHDVRGDFKLEWRPDTLSTLIFRPNVRYSKTDTENKGWSENSNENRLPVNYKQSNSSNASNNYSIHGRLQYFRKFNSKGRNLFLGVNFGLSDSDSESLSFSQINFYTYGENGELIKDSISINDRRTDRAGNNSNYNISASYTEPIFKNLFLQLKYEFAYKKSNSQSTVYAQQFIDEIPQGYEYVDSLSNGVTNFYNSHNLEFSVRGVSPKMMYNAGIDFTPQYSRSETYMGPNSNHPVLSQRVVNFAPAVLFRYLFTKQHVLTLRYRGQSNEPEIESLQEIIDVNDPLDLRYGNPELKPSFNHNFMLFYSKFIPDAMRSFSLNLFYSNTMNSIVNRVIYNPDNGIKRSYKENVNGNWDVRGYFSFNTPFRNKKFTLSSNTNTSYSHGVNFASSSNEDDKQLSITRNFIAGEKITGNYRCDAFDISLNASVNYNLIRSSTQEKHKRENYDYIFGGSTNVNLPWGIFFSTDINYRIKRGYSGGFNKDEVIWNGQVSKNLLKNKASVRIKMYDILQQQTNLSRTISDSSVSDTEYNTLGSYVMVHFVYRLNTLGGGNSGKKGKAGNQWRREGFDRHQEKRMRM